MSKKEEKWRDIESNNAGLISVCSERVDYGGRMVWVYPIPERERKEMQMAGLAVTVFFVIVSLILAALA
jgi:hypothetical protein